MNRFAPIKFRNGLTTKRWENFTRSEKDRWHKDHPKDTTPDAKTAAVTPLAQIRAR